MSDDRINVLPPEELERRRLALAALVRQKRRTGGRFVFPPDQQEFIDMVHTAAIRAVRAETGSPRAETELVKDYFFAAVGLAWDIGALDVDGWTVGPAEGDQEDA